MEADVFLLTENRPVLLPLSKPGLSLVHSDPATQSLLDDLRSDDGMGWVPEDAWLSKISIDSSAGDLNYDLAVDAAGQRIPSPVAAGLVPAGADGFPETATLAAGALLLLACIVGLAVRRRNSVSKA